MLLPGGGVAQAKIQRRVMRRERIIGVRRGAVAFVMHGAGEGEAVRENGMVVDRHIGLPMRHADHEHIVRRGIARPLQTRIKPGYAAKVAQFRRDAPLTKKFYAVIAAAFR